MAWIPMEPATTVIEFWVSVPVLSVQMTEALAIVSHEPRTRTSRFSYVIRFVANASARVTASGRPVNRTIHKSMQCKYSVENPPSGTATTIKVTAMMRMLTKAIPF